MKLAVNKKRNKNIVNDLSESLETGQLGAKYHHQAIVSASPLPIVTMDRNGVVTTWNPAAESVFLWREEEVLGKNNPIIPPDKVQKFVELNNQVLMGQTFENLECPLVRKDSSHIDLSISMAPVLDEKNEVTGTIMIVVDMKDIKIIEDQLRNSLAGKDLLLREVRHRVKNNLQAISGLLNIQAASVNDYYASKVLLDSQNRVLSMALIHEKLYQFEDLTRIDLSEYVRSLVDSLYQTLLSRNTTVRFDIDVEGITLNVDTAIPCGLILNELITNSLTHAFHDEREGRIYIKVEEISKNKFIMIFEDNGTGLPLDLDIDHANTLGIVLIRNFVNFLSGTVEIVESEGTSYRIIFSEWQEAGVELY